MNNLKNKAKKVTMKDKVKAMSLERPVLSDSAMVLKKTRRKKRNSGQMKKNTTTKTTTSGTEPTLRKIICNGFGGMTKKAFSVKTLTNL